MQRILHLADLHLGFAHRYLGERAEKRAEEALETLNRIVDWALEPEHAIEAVLIAGDLFETHQPDPKIVGRTIGALRRLTEAGKTLVTLPGNHDEYSYPQCVYRREAEHWPGILVTNPTPERIASFTLDDRPCHLYGLAFTDGLTPARLPELTIEEPADTSVHLGILHGTLDADPSDRTYRIDSATLTKAGIAYAALGHIHKPAETRLGEGYAVYPGTPNGKGFDDPGTAGLVTVAFPGGRPLIKREPFPIRAIETREVALDRFNTLAELLQDFEGQADPERILRLRLLGTRLPDLETDYLQGRLQGSFFHLEIDDHTLGLDRDEITSLAEQPSVRGLFVKSLRREIETAEAAGDEARAAILQQALRRGLRALGHGGATPHA